MTVRVIKSRRLSLSGNVARMEEVGSVLKMLTGKPIGKRTLGRTRCRWEHNIRMSVKKVGVSTRNGFDSAQDRDYCGALENVVFNLRVP